MKAILISNPFYANLCIPIVFGAFILLFQQSVLVGIMAVIYAWRLSFNIGEEVKVDEKTNPANHISGM